jgi:hypothetical protein
MASPYWNVALTKEIEIMQSLTSIKKMDENIERQKKKIIEIHTIARNFKILLETNLLKRTNSVLNRPLVYNNYRTRTQ